MVPSTQYNTHSDAATARIITYTLFRDAATLHRCRIRTSQSTLHGSSYGPFSPPRVNVVVTGMDERTAPACARSNPWYCKHGTFPSVGASDPRQHESNTNRRVCPSFMCLRFPGAYMVCRQRGARSEAQRSEPLQMSLYTPLGWTISPPDRRNTEQCTRRGGPFLMSHGAAVTS